jgi:hypothetical protein
VELGICVVGFTHPTLDVKTIGCENVGCKKGRSFKWPSSNFKQPTLVQVSALCGVHVNLGLRNCVCECGEDCVDAQQCHHATFVSNGPLDNAADVLIPF